MSLLPTISSALLRRISGLMRSPAGSSVPLLLEDQDDIAGGPGPGDILCRGPVRTLMSLGPGAELYQDQDGRRRDDLG